MPKYVIERNIPKAGQWTAQQQHDVAGKSCQVLCELGPEIQWVHSYVTDDKLFCIYVAPSADLIRQHAARGGFPADAIREVRTTIDPTTAE